jgi:hypothetical protein
VHYNGFVGVVWQQTGFYALIPERLRPGKESKLAAPAKTGAVIFTGLEWGIGKGFRSYKKEKS